MMWKEGQVNLINEEIKEEWLTCSVKPSCDHNNNNNNNTGETLHEYKLMAYIIIMTMMLFVCNTDERVSK